MNQPKIGSLNVSGFSLFNRDKKPQNTVKPQPQGLLQLFNHTNPSNGNNDNSEIQQILSALDKKIPATRRKFTETIENRTNAHPNLSSKQLLETILKRTPQIIRSIQQQVGNRGLQLLINHIIEKVRQAPTQNGKRPREESMNVTQQNANRMQILEEGLKRLKTDVEPTNATQQNDSQEIQQLQTRLDKLHQPIIVKTVPTEAKNILNRQKEESMRKIMELEPKIKKMQQQFDTQMKANKDIERQIKNLKDSPRSGKPQYKNRILELEQQYTKQVNKLFSILMVKNELSQQKREAEERLNETTKMISRL